MNTNRNAKGAIAAIMYQNLTAEIAQRSCGIIITAARTVDKGVVDVEDNESWEWLKIHALPLVLRGCLIPIINTTFIEISTTTYQFLFFPRLVPRLNLLNHLSKSNQY
jgi:hypothetical protein